MHIESREEFIHEKKMLLNPEYKKQYEQEQKLGIRHKLEFKFWEEVD